MNRPLKSRLPFSIPRIALLALVAMIHQTLPMGAQTVGSQSLLASVRGRIAKAIERSPKYACTDAIQRYWFRDTLPFVPRDACTPQAGAEYNLFKRDRVRLQVSVIQGAETYSWPGAAPFEATRVDRLVKEGPITSGTFFAFLSDLFVNGNAQYTFTGVHDVNGRPAGTYRFTVPVAESHFIAPTPRGDLALAYSGTFAADLDSGALLNVEIWTAPSETDAPFCSAKLEANYPNPQSEALLPANVLVDVLDKNGGRTRSVIAYTDCRQFVGSSVIHFGEPLPSLTTRRHTEAPLSLPAGLVIQIRLTSSIRSASSWAGDPIEGLLESDVKCPASSVVIAPKGARVEGRLIRIVQHFSPNPSFTVGLTFNAILVGEKRYSVSLVPDQLPLHMGGTISRSLADPLLSGTERTVAVFQLPGHTFTLGRRLVSRWISIPEE